MTMRDRLSKMVDELAIRRAPPGETFTLSSGKTSTFYLDMRIITLTPASSFYVAEIMADMIRGLKTKVDAIGGPAIGAVAMIGSLAFLNGMLHNDEDYQSNEPKYLFFFVRKEQKGHGMKKLLEGPVKAGQVAVIVEDVTTTGQSALDAVLEARKEGLTVSHVFTIIDREEGGRELLKSNDVELHSIFTKTDFGL